eukprot:13224817-Alexandrium_andersonii.AAC.1
MNKGASTVNSDRWQLRASQNLPRLLRTPIEALRTSEALSEAIRTPWDGASRISPFDVTSSSSSTASASRSSATCEPS